MKLVTVFMLSALPLYCSAGSGCQFIEDIVSKTIDASMSPAEFTKDLEAYIETDAEENAFQKMKHLFNSQSKETLANIQEMMTTVYNSFWCALY
ncbi:mammaglobin-B-like [Erinaceus europaeus]|uniref:Mammaglobin-B-like n=1 Tax=Erinaceus europaeus TaxID=9365 RepID=A0A1S2ZY84_ERIEU|nr:mammaglobin-B-like [Erinaceus europaeus]